MGKRVIFVVVVLAVLSGFSADAVDFKLLGSFGGNFYDVKVKGNYAYVATSNGLSIFNVKKPSLPKLVGSYVTSARANGVYVSKNRIYLATNEGIVILEIAKPFKPKLLGFFKRRGKALSIFVSDTKAYVAAGKQGIVIIDVSNPSKPNVIGSYNTTGFAVDITLDGTIAYVADRQKGLKIIDVSDSSAPVLLGKYDKDRAHNVFISGKKAYVSDVYNGLKIIDVSDASAPVLLGKYDLKYIHDIQISDKTAYIVAGTFFILLDMSDPAIPVLISSYDFGSIADDIFLSNAKAYIIGGYLGLHIVDVKDPYSPKLLGQSGIVNINSVTVKKNVAYATAGRDGLLTVDVSNPNSPKLLGSYKTSGNAYDVIVSGKKAYVTDTDKGFLILDVSKPSKPKLIGYYDTEGIIPSIHISKKKAYLAVKEKGLIILDIRKPSKPKILSSYETNYRATDVYVAGKKAYIVTSGEGDTSDNDDSGPGNLLIIDVSKPNSPKLLGTYNTEAISNVFVAGSKAYIGFGWADFAIIDVSDSASPQSFSRTTTEDITFYNIYVSGSRAYFAGFRSIIGVFNIANPASPRFLNSFKTSGNPRDISLVGNKIFVADSVGGLKIYRISFSRKPDLKPVITTSPKKMKRGKKAKVVTLIHNIGNAPAPRSQVSFYLSVDKKKSIGKKDKYLGLEYVSTINPKERGRVTKELRISQSVNPGQYYIKVICDYDKAMAESSEKNNVDIKKITVK